MAEARVEMDYRDLDQAFPDIDPGVQPFGSRILVQVKSVVPLTKGGIYIPEDSQQTEFWNTQVAKVIALGPVAFKNRDTLVPWQEGAWCREGDYVRVPKYGGDKWFVNLPGAESSRIGVDRVCFTIFNDLDIIGQITGNPLEIIAYL